jgi:DNA-binding LytR/AlgR family response regulator
MRVLIVDDERAARRRLALMLEDLDVEVVGEAGDGVTALDLVRLCRPDVILLDIAMPEVDGFDVVRHLPAPRPLVVFQTAYDEHALRAFEHEALDYIVKPVTRARLEQALERARRRLSEAQPALTTASLARLQLAAPPVLRRRSRLLVRSGAGHRLVPLREVMRVSATERIAYVYATTGRFLTDYTLSELEARMAGTLLRVSRADLVNLDRIDRIVSNGDGSATLTLTDGTTVRVSRRRAAGVRAALEA